MASNLDGAAASIDEVAAQSAADKEAAALTAYGSEDLAHAMSRQTLQILLGHRWTWPIKATIEILPLNESLYLTGRPVKEIIDVQDMDGNDIDYTLESGHIVKLVGYNRQSGVTYKSVDHGDLSSLMNPLVLSVGGWPQVPFFRHPYVYITYTYGSPPDAIMQRALDVLATEFQKQIDGDDTCRLPKNATNVSRQGVSVTIFDPSKAFDNMRTGIYEVDLCISLHNPARARARSRVFSPAIRTGRFSDPQAQSPGRTASDYDLVVQAGANFTKDFFYLQNDEVTPVDLTGYTARCQIRRAASSSSPLLLDVNPTIDVLTGKVELSLLPEQTSLLVDQSYVYAIELSDSPTNVIRLIGGRVFVSPEVVF